MRTMRLSLALFAAALLPAPAIVQAKTIYGCDRPDVAPTMPQGATASDQEMREGREALQTYVKALEAFQACLKKRADQAPPDTKPEEKAQWMAAGDDAVGAAQSIANVYSAQLRAYKGRQ